MYCYQPKYDIWLNNKRTLNEEWAKGECFVNTWWALCEWRAWTKRSVERKWKHCDNTRKDGKVYVERFRDCIDSFDDISMHHAWQDKPLP